MKRFVLIAALALAPAAALAQSYPSKPLRLYTQFGPGSPGDVFARVFAASLSNVMGQPVVVDSRPGGGGMLVAGLTVRAEPDGYTAALLTATVPMSTAVPSGNPPNFDPQKDLQPIVMVIDSSSLLAASASLPVTTMQQLIDYAKKNPGKLSYGTTGIASSHHLNGEEVNLLAGIRTVHVPYKTAPIADTASGVLPLTYAITAQALPFIKSGKVHALAMTTDRKFRALPDVPLMAEVVPGFEPAPAFSGLYGPAQMPAAVLKRLHDDSVKAVTAPEVVAKVQSIGFEVATSKSPEDFQARIRRGWELTARIAKEAKIEAQ